MIKSGFWKIECLSDNKHDLVHYLNKNNIKYQETETDQNCLMVEANIDLISKIISCRGVIQALYDEKLTRSFKRKKLHGYF